LDRYLDQAALNKGLPLYVSAFRSHGALSDLLRCLVAELGFIDSPDSEFIHIQSLPLNEQKNALLASAAIPLLFAPKKVNESPYSDGGLGGWQKMQGNTPITPLLHAGYKMIIVTHLSDGSLWSRQDFPDATILEIRPQSNITRDGSAKDLLGFDAKKIPSWIEQGYQDTLHCMERVKNVMQARFTFKGSEMAVNKSLKVNDNLDTELVQAMNRL
jgi:NTE family protein